jgi:predicted ATP-grasp superfamily ATP-dependent carboligase
MDGIYKKAFIGYEQNSVDDFLEEENKKFSSLLMRNNKVLADLRRENQTLEEQKKELAAKLSEYQKRKVNLANHLFEMFMSKTELLYNAEQQENEKQTVQNRILSEYKLKNASLQKKVKDFIEKIESEDID